jgi:biopolymer transport protein ExbD
MTDPRNSPTQQTDRAESAAADPPPVHFQTAYRSSAEAELDMTPMCDVTFLLLIFFMVTAAFALQKSFEVPAPDESDPSTEARTLEDLEDDPRFVIVRIDRFNTFHVATAAWEDEREAPSEQDLLIALRDAADATVDGQSPTDLLVAADGECGHGRVVTALDAGVAVGMEKVQFITVEEDDSW